MKPSYFLLSLFLILTLNTQILQAKAPEITLVSGAGPHPEATTEIDLQINTAEPSRCRWSYGEGYPFGAMYLEFDTANERDHFYTVSGIYKGSTTAYFVKCQDLATSIESSKDYRIDVIFGSGTVKLETLSGEGPHPSDVSEIDLVLKSDQSAECRVSAMKGYPYGALYQTLDSLDGLIHRYHIGGIYKGKSQDYFIKCKSLVTGVISQQDYVVSVEIEGDEIPTATINLESIFPANHSVSVPVNSTISIGYGETLNPDALEYELKLTSGGYEVEGATLIEASSIHFYPHNALQYDTTYHVSVAGKMGARQLESSQFSFKTKVHEPIEVTNTYPAPSSIGVSTGINIISEFSAPIDDPNTMVGLRVKQGDLLVQGHLKVLGNRIEFNPDEDLLPGVDVEVNIELTFEDQASPLQHQWRFKTAAEQVALCDDYYVSDFRLLDARDISEIPRVEKPGKSTSFIDPTFGTCIARVTDHSQEPPVNFARAEYSRRQAFNANNTYVAALAEDGHWHLYNANSNQYEKLLEGPASDAELQWDPINPDLLYFMDLNGGMKIYELDIRTNSRSVLADFEHRLPWSSASRVWTKSEGTFSADGRYWGMQVETADFQPLGLMVWDRKTDRIVGTWDFAAKGVGRPDHTSMSPSGDYIVASWDGNEFGTTAFIRDFSKQIKLHHKSEHSDIALLENGHDAYVSVDYQSNGGEVFMVEIQTNTRTPLFDTYIDGSATALHFSGKAYKKPGWVLVSTYGGVTRNSEHVWLHDKVFALELKRNPNILGIAHHHSLARGYWTEPHATVNQDFTRVAFNSNWNVDSETDVDLYQVVLPEDVLKPSEVENPGGQLPLINPKLSFKPNHILFVGNSLTGHYDIPSTLKQMAEEKGVSLEIDTEIYGGSTFQQHYYRADTRDKLSQGNYELVVLQGGAYGAITNTESFFTYGSLLSETVVQSNMTPLFYMTWHHRDYFSSEARLVKENYLSLANRNQQTLSPVGVAFTKVVSQFPDIQLFSDGTHQNETGAYLSALVFYGLLLQEKPTELVFNGSIDPSVAEILKQVAEETLTEVNGLFK